MRNWVAPLVAEAFVRGRAPDGLYHVPLVDAAGNLRSEIPRRATIQGFVEQMIAFYPTLVYDFNLCDPWGLAAIRLGGTVDVDQ